MKTWVIETMTAEIVPKSKPNVIHAQTSRRWTVVPPRHPFAPILSVCFGRSQIGMSGRWLRCRGHTGATLKPSLNPAFNMAEADHPMVVGRLQELVLNICHNPHWMLSAHFTPFPHSSICIRGCWPAIVNGQKFTGPRIVLWIPISRSGNQAYTSQSRSLLNVAGSLIIRLLWLGDKVQSTFCWSSREKTLNDMLWSRGVDNAGGRWTSAT